MAVNTVFLIIANILFNMPRPIISSFNTHHKTRLQRAGGSLGRVLPEGVAFFTNRTRLDYADMVKALASEGYTMDDAGLWAYHNKSGQPYTSGTGIIGRSLFAWSLSTLSQQAEQARLAAEKAEQAKAARAAKPKTARVTKAKPETVNASV